MRVILPAAPLRRPLRNNTVFGSAKFGRLKRLKNSARNWRFAFSLRGVFFMRAKSTWEIPGILKVFLPKVP